MKRKIIGLLIFAVVIFNSGLSSVATVYAQANPALGQQNSSTNFFPDLLIDPIPSIFLYYNDIHFTVRNIGQRTLSEPFQIRFQWVNANQEPVGAPVFYTHSEPLEQAQTYSVLASGAISYIGPSLRFNVQGKPDIAAYVSVEQRPVGATGVQVTLDPTNEIAELNENNNSLWAPQDPKVDVEVKGVRFDIVNGYRAMMVRIKNNGTDPVVFSNSHMPRTSMMLRWVDARGESLQWYSSSLQRTVLGGVQPMIIPGPGEEVETAVYMSEWAADGVLAHPPENAVALHIEADDALALHEPNEENNELTVPVANLEFVPDLFIDPTNQLRLQPDQLRFTVRNIGQRPVTEPFDIQFQWLDAQGAPVGTPKIYTHTAGLGVAQVFRRFTNGGVVFTGGEYTFDSNEHPEIDEYVLAANKPAEATRFMVTIDPANVLPELNEANNSDTTVQDPLVDLMVRDVRTETVNGRYALVVTVANVGGNRDPFPVNARAPRVSFILRWLDARGQIISWNSPDGGRLVHGGVQSFTPPRGGESVDVVVYALPTYADGFFQTVPANAVSMKIEVDDAQRFNEEREDNNIVMIPRDSIALVPDLFLDTVRGGVLYPDELAFTVRNIGQRAVTEQIPMEFQWVDASGASVGQPFNYVEERDIPVASMSGRYANGDPMYSGASLIFSSKDIPALNTYIHYTNKPASATMLKVSIDPQNTIPELVETNARQFLQQGPVVDVAIVGARTEMTDRGYALIFTATNVGLEEDTLQGGSRRSVGLAWLDANGNTLSWRSSFSGRMETAAITELPHMRPGEIKEGIVYATEGSADGFFLHKPENAVAIRFEADDARRYHEPNEENNVFVFYLEPPEEDGEMLAENDEAQVEEALAQELAETEDQQTVIEPEQPFVPETVEVISADVSQVEPVSASTTVYEVQQVELPGGEVVDVPPADPVFTPSVEPPTTIDESQVAVMADEELPQVVEEENAQIKSEQESVQAQPENTEAPRPKVLPGSFLYPFKEAGRSLRLLATFDDKKEAALHLKYSGERALEMSELVDSDKKEEATAAAKKYKEQIEKLSESIEKIKEKDEKAAATVEEKAVRQELLHQVLLGKVERVAPVKQVEIIKDAREETLGLLGKKIASVTESKPEKMQELISVLEDAHASPFGVVRSAEVLQAIAEKVENKKAQEALQETVDNKLERFAKEFESQEPEQQKKFETYLERAGGDDVGYMKIVQSVKNEIHDDNASEALVAAEEKVITAIENRVQEASGENGKTTVTLFDSLDGKTFSDLQIIKKLEERPQLKEALEQTKEQAFTEFVRVLKTADTPTQGTPTQGKDDTPTQGTPTQGKVETPTQGKPTLSDLEVFAELKSKLAPKEKILIENLEKETIVTLQKEAIENKKTTEFQNQLQEKIKELQKNPPVVDMPKIDTPTQETPTQGKVETPTQGLPVINTPTQGKVETPTQGKVETPTQGKVETPTQGKPVIEKPKVEVPKTIPVLPIKALPPKVETPTQGKVETPTQGKVETPTQGKPVACTMEYVPVCGEDGVTYSNKCTAEAAGATVAYEEKCIEVTYTKSATMEITSSGFVPFVVDVEAGGMVTFINNHEFTLTLHIDGFGHPVILSVGKSFEYTTLDSKGIFNVRGEVGQVGAKDIKAIIVTH